MSWAFLLAGCIDGTLRTDEANDRLRAAFVVDRSDLTLEYPNVERTDVFLANTELSCRDFEDGVGTDAQRDLLAAFSREYARVVLLFLYRERDASPEATYKLRDGADGGQIATGQPVASATYWAVNEAVLDDQDGILRYYTWGDTRGDLMYVPQVGEPGTVRIDSASDSVWRGSFQLDAVDVSGRFRAETCSPEAIGNLFNEVKQELSKLAEDDTGSLELPPQLIDSEPSG